MKQLSIRWILFLELLVLLPLSLAQPVNRPEDVSDDFPEQLSEQFKEGFADEIPSKLINGFTQPLQETIQPLINIAKYILGGIFGLYLLLVLVRIYYERKKVKLLKDIRFDLDHLNQHFGVSHSAHRKGFFGRIWAKLRGKE